MEFNATFIVAFVSFIIFVFVMNSILYRPINDIVKKRKNIVDANYEEVNKNSEKCEQFLKTREEKLLLAKVDAKNLISEKTEEANNKKDIITQDAKSQAKNNIEEYNLYYKNATADAKAFLRGEVINLAQAISDKFLGENEKINADDFKELLDGITQG
ncbi:ATP synthase F0 subunit B [bacterium]|nr:ATP synthase F0 subunit B [bacterium]